MPINLLHFWQWSFSDILSNTLRGILAEFIVAGAAAATNSPREEWDAYDLITKQGLKIEVKSSAYLQSWEQKKLSTISFGIQPTRIWEDSDTRSQKAARRSDVYVFCVLKHKDMRTVNPLNLDQWDFYILETAILDAAIPTQKTITLTSLLTFQPKTVHYNELLETLNKIT
ncbi:MAG: hypothetical protein Q9N67_08730 [Ghiorsea sp.]|nr:hypothetical protein [Ghiorsea sp.]